LKNRNRMTTAEVEARMPAPFFEIHGLLT
jgi:hypothetical protein